MKLTKRNAKNLLIIVLCVFVLIPIVFLMFNLNPIEGYTNYTENTVSSDSIPRVEIFGKNLGKNNETDAVYTKEGESLYCPGGNIICPEGYSVKEQNEDGSYKYWCKKPSEDASGAHVRCENYLSKNEVSSLNIRAYDKKDDAGNFLTETVYDVTSENSLGLQDTTLAGFVLGGGALGPHAPMEISGEYLLMKNDDGTDKFKATPCFLYEGEDKCLEYYDINNGESSEEEVSEGVSVEEVEKCDQTPNIKCVADNGTKKGDPLCCGQTGVVQDIKHNCPVNYPYCVGYKCGESWGRCSETPAENPQ